MSKSASSKIVTASFFILFPIYIAILDLFPELAGENIKDILESKLGDSFLSWIIIAWITLGTIFIWWIQPFLERKSRKEESQKEGDTDELLLKGTLKRYRFRIKQKMAGQSTFELDLQLKFLNPRQDNEILKKYMIKSSRIRLADYHDLFYEFKTNIKRLLIVGDPGSGKTLLLLRFAEFLIDARNNPGIDRVPVIVDSGSWRNEELTFTKWLERQLPNALGESGISKQFAKELIQNNQILPLIDGFDEIPTNHRTSFLNSLNIFLRNSQNQSEKNYSGPELILCSRTNEFKMDPIILEVFGVIEIQPLKRKIVKKELNKLISQNNVTAGLLLKSLNNEPSLQQALDTAFYVHVALALYAKSWEYNLASFKNENKEKLQRTLIKSYLDQELQLLVDCTKYSFDEAKRWLSWLAYSLEVNRKGLAFEFADLQPSWLRNTLMNKLTYGFLFGVSFGVLAGIVFGSIGGLIFSTEFGVDLGILTAVLGGVSAGIAGGIIFAIVGIPQIEYEEVIYIDFKIYTLIVNVIKGTGLGLIFGLFGAILVAIFSDIINGLIGGLTGGLVGGVLFGINTGIVKSKKYPKLQRPYQRVTANLLFYMVSWGIVILVIFLILQLQFSLLVDEELELYYIFAYGSVGFLTGLVLGFCRHGFYNFLLLNFFFRITGLVPNNFLHFLNAASESTGILEADGGHWRFRHLLLLKELASNWKA